MMCKIHSFTICTNEKVRDSTFSGSTYVMSSSNLDAPPGYEAPNIAAARRFHAATLPRRIIDGTQKTGYRLANVGEIADSSGNLAKLYNFFDKASSLNEFGVGISLYFKTLKALFVLLVLCAFTSLVYPTHLPVHQCR